MKPKCKVFRYGDIIATVWFGKIPKKNKSYRFMIFCHGLPSHPYQHNPAKIEKFIELGFILVYPNYIGTWASYGIMSWEKCVDTILQTVDFLKNGEGTELYENSKIKWGVKDIILVGGSFGGSIALVAGAKSHDIKKIISVAAPTNWKNHSKIPRESKESIENLYYSIIRGWENLWRIPNKNEWDRLAKGEADINPIDYTKELKNKDVFLIHGRRDNVVSSKRSIDLYKCLKKGEGKHRLLILEKEGHMGNDSIGQKGIIEKILLWL